MVIGARSHNKGEKRKNWNKKNGTEIKPNIVSAWEGLEMQRGADIYPMYTLAKSLEE